MALALVIVKSMQYRGSSDEEYSNRYCLNGPPPMDVAGWRALALAVANLEAEVVPNDVIYERAYGYVDTDPATHATWSDQFDGSAMATLVGQLAIGAGDEMPGDCAVWVRWKLDKLNSRGKSVYLRKYFHPALQGGNADGVFADQRTALLAFGAAMRALDVGGDDRQIVGPDGTFTLGHSASTFITTRTLKRRGKRPPT